MNVLLFTMSTISKKQKTTYEIPEKYCIPQDKNVGDSQNNIIIGESQMEPVPKLLMKYFAGQNPKQKLDEIYVLTSYDTTVASIDLEGRNAHTFFKDQLSEFASKFGIVQEDIPEYCQINLFPGQCEEDDVNRKITVDVNLALKNCVKAIRKNKADSEKKGEKFNLYIDIHGGPREEQLTTDAVMLMLNNEGIPVQEAFSIAYRDGAKVQKVEIVTDYLLSFKLVSAIDSFVNYGKARAITEMFSQTSDRVANILSAISLISDSILLCNPMLFKNGLNNLKKCITKEAMKEIENENPLFWILLEYIRNDYEKYRLLEDKPNDIDIIRWCIRKEFYQQAITFIENQFPAYYIKKKIVKFNKNTFNLIKYIEKKRKGWEEEDKCLFENYASDNYEIKIIQNHIWRNIAEQILKHRLENMSAKELKEIAKTISEMSGVMDETGSDTKSKYVEHCMDHLRPSMQKIGSLNKDELKKLLELEDAVDPRSYEGVKYIFCWLNSVSETEFDKAVDEAYSYFYGNDKFFVDDSDKNRQDRWKHIGNYLSGEYEKEKETWRNPKSNKNVVKARTQILAYLFIEDADFIRNLASCKDFRTALIMQNRSGKAYDISSDVKDEFLPKLDLLLCMQTFLKNERNRSNHGLGTEKRTSTEQLGRLMSDYVELLDYVSREGMKTKKQRRQK